MDWFSRETWPHLGKFLFLEPWLEKSKFHLWKRAWQREGGRHMDVFMTRREGEIGYNWV